MPVVDASVVVDWVAPGIDPDGPAGLLLARLADDGRTVLAPRLLLEEVTNALLTGIRQRRWSGAEADSAFVLLRGLPVRLVDQPADLDRAYELSRRYDEHPVYDLVYVAVAERLGEQLVTADAALRRRLAGLDFVVGPG
jgi:predicted nucleic acid-binding protein